jgi:diguanylate cyclase (GGDEF)-like protein
MRSITGWRFVLVIVMPILLASVGVLGTTNDLLQQVSQNADSAERTRNREIVRQFLIAAERDFEQLARDNASWSEAASNVYPLVNGSWFNTTLGSINSIGASYDTVAILEKGVTKPLLVGGRRGTGINDVRQFLGSGYAPLMARLEERASDESLVTSYAMTSDGPALLALAKIRKPSGVSANLADRQLLIVRHFTDGFLKNVASAYLLGNLSAGIERSPDATSAHVVKTVDGIPAFSLSWTDRSSGVEATLPAKRKASGVLSFLILVMTGIGLVCWRLVQSLLVKEEEARHEAKHDALTGLPNRAGLAMAMAGQGDVLTKGYAIAYIDLDGFKAVNDSFGHLVGDALLRKVGADLVKSATGAVVLARVGGDEFVAVYAGPEAEQRCAAYGRRVLEGLVQPITVSGRVASIGASIGIALALSGEEKPLEVLRRADVAMYQAKNQGKRQICHYLPAMDEEREETLAIAEELRDVVARNEIDIVFQPVVSLRNGRVSAVETLARWPKSSQRQVSADRFIRVAEECGVIDALGEQILEKACIAGKTWKQLRLAVNVSALQLNNPRFVERSLAILERHGINPHRVEFEITETSLIGDNERAQGVFRALQRAGVKIALDDFGTGFSSIGYLRTFKFDRIKLDRSIVSKVLTSPEELAIVQGALLVARGLSAEVTAEGVEREAEVSVLKLAGCTEVQGYHFHRPMSVADVNALVSAMTLTPATLAPATRSGSVA